MPRYEKASLRIATLPDLATSDILEGFEFIECEILGPAVLAFIDRVTLTYSSFDGDFNAMLWEIPMSRLRVIGAIGLSNCTFTRCTFRRIGFAGPAEFIAQFRKGTVAAEGITSPPQGTPPQGTPPATL
jgi:hypothetical protein